MLALASHYLAQDGVQPLDDGRRAAFLAENEALAEQALRVLALASRTIAAESFDPAGDCCPGSNQT
jgi:P-type Ca2+ transporter type 2C